MLIIILKKNRTAKKNGNTQALSGQSIPAFVQSSIGRSGSIAAYTTPFDRAEINTFDNRSSHGTGVINPLATGSGNYDAEIDHDAGETSDDHDDEEDEERRPDHSSTSNGSKTRNENNFMNLNADTDCGTVAIGWGDHFSPIYDDMPPDYVK